MTLNLHLNFSGNCNEAFSFYEKALGIPRAFTMTYAEAPEGVPVPQGWGDKVMHTSLPLGSGTLMGCDAPPNSSTPLGGFQISIDLPTDAEVHRVFAILGEGGSVQMPLAPTFWSPLFGMCKDKFGIAWMVSIVQTPQP